MGKLISDNQKFQMKLPKIKCIYIMLIIKEKIKESDWSRRMLIVHSTVNEQNKNTDSKRHQ